VAEIISDVVTCEIKHRNNFEIILVLYFTCNQVLLVFSDIRTDV